MTSSEPAWTGNPDSRRETKPTTARSKPEPKPSLAEQVDAAKRGLLAMGTAAAHRALAWLERAATFIGVENMQGRIIELKDRGFSSCKQPMRPTSSTPPR